MDKEEYKNFYDGILKKYENNDSGLNKYVSSGGRFSQYTAYSDIDKCLEAAKRQNRPMPCNRLDESGVDIVLSGALKRHKDEICDWLFDGNDEVLFVRYDGLLGGGYICFPDGTVRYSTRVTLALKRSLEVNELGFYLMGVCCTHNPEQLGPVVSNSVLTIH